MDNDPGETLDVPSQYPEVVKALLQIAEKYCNDLGDDLTGVKGAVEEPLPKFSFDI